jgi:hypothetical protein
MIEANRTEEVMRHRLWAALGFLSFGKPELRSLGSPLTSGIEIIHYHHKRCVPFFRERMVRAVIKQEAPVPTHNPANKIGLHQINWLVSRAPAIGVPRDKQAQTAVRTSVL